MGKTAVDYDLDLLRCPLRDQNKESTFLFLYPPVVVQLGCCNQKTKQNKYQVTRVLYKQQKFTAHSSGGWRSETRGLPPDHVSDFLLRPPMVEGARELCEVFFIRALIPPKGSTLMT